MNVNMTSNSFSKTERSAFRFSYVKTFVLTFLFLRVMNILRIYIYVFQDCLLSLPVSYLQMLCCKGRGMPCLLTQIDLTFQFVAILPLLDCLFLCWCFTYYLSCNSDEVLSIIDFIFYFLCHLGLWYHMSETIAQPALKISILISMFISMTLGKESGSYLFQNKSNKKGHNNEK